MNERPHLERASAHAQESADRNGKSALCALPTGSEMWQPNERCEVCNYNLPEFCKYVLKDLNSTVRINYMLGEYRPHLKDILAKLGPSGKSGQSWDLGGQGSRGKPLPPRPLDGEVK